MDNLRSNSITIPDGEMARQREFASLVSDILSSAFFRAEPRAFVHTYGCQGNVSDGERMKGILTECGFTLAENVEDADFVLFNTCAVREHAQDRVFGNVGKLKNLKEKRPGMRIALCGCMMQQAQVAEKIRASYSFVDMVFGTHVIHRLPELLYALLTKGGRVFELTDSDGIIAEGLPVRRDSAFKAWLPVMYGCNNFCSYCIVPYVRGRERSRDPEAVLGEARELAAAGYKDITLLGQNVNSYGKGTDTDFAALMSRINDIDGDFLIRFMTSYPKDCTHRLLDTMAACGKAAKHLHLPFQSGNDRILKEMNRGYTAEKYLSLIDYARKVMPELSITSDVIVGFPGETDEEFEDTVELVRRAEFTSLFTFIFSPREGTRAASMDDPATREQKTARFAKLCAVQDDIAANRNASLAGKTFRVLCEGAGKHDGLIAGRTEGNVVIEFPAPSEVVGTFRRVKVETPRTWTLYGELVD